MYKKVLDYVFKYIYTRDIFIKLEEGNHFLCANERIKNIVLQQAAKLAKTREKKLVIFVATSKHFDERGSFEKVEF